MKIDWTICDRTHCRNLIMFGKSEPLCFHGERSEEDGKDYYANLEVPEWCPCAVEHLMSEQKDGART
jgi:hypothetical protein